MKKCKVKTCLGNSKAIGYCLKHYKRFRRNGTVKRMRREKTFGSLIHRIIANTKTNKKTGCWEWQGYKNEKGYGKIKFGGKCIRVHRYVYEFYNDVDLNIDELVCHSCDNPKCCNPEHLWAGSNLANQYDRIEKGRHKGRNKI